MNRHSWQQKEDEAIKLLVEQYGKNDWTKISVKLKETCALNRSGKQCRERWYNHLDPFVNKRQWTLQEQNLLFQKHRELGNKWKQISKQLVGRTDNDIKNHFYSTLRRSLRRLNKTMGQKNSTSQMRQIKPSVLSTIMSIIYSQQSQTPALDVELNNKLKDLPLLIFQFSSIKPVKNRISSSSSDLEFRQKISQIFQLINQFNLQYQLDKSYRKANGFIKILERDNALQFQPVVLTKQKSKKVQKKVEVEVKQQYVQGTSQPAEYVKIELMQENKEDQILSTMFQKQNHVAVQPNYHQYELQGNFRSRRISLEEDQIQLQMNFADYQDPSSLPQQSNFSDLIIIGKQCKREEFQNEKSEEIMDEVLEINYEQA